MGRAGFVALLLWTRQRPLSARMGTRTQPPVPPGGPISAPRLNFFHAESLVSITCCGGNTRQRGKLIHSLNEAFLVGNEIDF